MPKRTTGADGSRNDFLPELPGDGRDEVARRARSTEVVAGHYIYEPEFAIVDEGTVRAFVTDAGGPQLAVSYVGQGGAFGLAHELRRSYPSAFQAVTHPAGPGRPARYRWRKRAQIDAGDQRGTKSFEVDALEQARRRIKEPEAELKVVRAASALVEEGAVDPKGSTRLSES